MDGVFPMIDVAPFPAGDTWVDSEGQRAFLMAKLDMACAAVATRGGCLMPRESATVAPPSQLVHDVTMTRDKEAVGPIGLASLSAVQNQPCVQVRSKTTGSSGEQSEDGQITGSMNLADIRRERRMLCNKESARRSRLRKQAHEKELQTQVSELKDEIATLRNKRADACQKSNESAVDKRVMKADVETLKAKVKLAEWIYFQNRVGK